MTELQIKFADIVAHCYHCDEQVSVNVHADALMSYSSLSDTMYMKVISASSRTVCGICGELVEISAVLEAVITERALAFFTAGQPYKTQKPQGDAQHGLSS